MPVLDSCGVAGGRLPHQGQGTAGADYVNTSNAKLADRGSSLKAAPSGTVWTAGTDVEGKQSSADCDPHAPQAYAWVVCAVAWTQKAW